MGSKPTQAIYYPICASISSAVNRYNYRSEFLKLLWKLTSWNVQSGWEWCACNKYPRCGCLWMKCCHVWERRNKETQFCPRHTLKWSCFRWWYTGDQIVPEDCTLSFVGARLALCYTCSQHKQSHLGERKYSSNLNLTIVQVHHVACKEFILKSAGKFQHHAIENICGCSMY